MPDTLIIIFVIGILAAALTYFIPAGSFESQDVTYLVDGAEKTRSVIDLLLLPMRLMKLVSLCTTRSASSLLVVALA
ncbi:membrane protein [Vibrio ishigakensis]|uniref:Membrane protein n=1 Tax=Vibrio ishigakensis TaxID=1481914 RepID=A0A0B8PM20_9VIBR|nr:membrane protein [Vibrio ishigakensis]